MQTTRWANCARFLPLTLTALLAACGNGGTSQPTTSGTAEAASQAEAAPIALGATGKAKGLDFSVSKVATPKGIEFGPQAKKGEVFVVASYTLKNTADEPLSLMNRPGFTLVDAQGQSYNPDDFLTASAGVDVASENSFIADINPGIAVEGRVAWKINAAAFDKGTWKLVVASDPALTFALK